MQGVVLQKGVHRLKDIRTQLGRSLATPLGIPLPEGRLLGRVVVPVGLSLALADTEMELDQALLQVGLDRLIAETHGQSLAHIAVGNRVKGTFYRDVAVGSYLGLSPGDQLKGLRRQGQEGGSLHLAE
jgi:hypothetical protein